ncbi:MAG: sarcosine oxidase subunit alpha, partial [Planctomycetes bacterium]|nr:sarcosine oxidase subunit alpha [Planctomycetota bacterium]
GRDGVRGVQVGPCDGHGRTRVLDCDLLLVSGGFSPLVHLASQSGAKPVWDAGRACFVPGTPVQSERSAGAAAGVFDLAGCLASGTHAGEQAATAAGFTVRPAPAPTAAPEPPLAIEPVFELPAPRRGRKAFVDFQNDVTADDVRLAHREGFRSVEHVKRYTTAGMGTDQGKLGNVNVIGILAGLEGVAPGAVGTTGYRPPYQPVSFGAIAGNDVESLALPARRTPITGWNERHGAKLFEAGLNWQRPACYLRDAEDQAAAIAREARACREAVGLYDATPLGKFEIAGPDAATFLNRVVTHRVDDLEPGQGRFGWMLREEGRLLDDGVTFRLGPNRFLHTCGTGMAEFVHAHLERLAQLEWPGLRVFIGVVTAQWATVAVCGPRTREVLAAAGTEVALDSAAFPFMALREGRVAGLPARIARVSYTGELGFEVSVRARDGLRLWEALVAAGAPHGITPVGSEASMVMRCEKGFVSAGYEGDGIVDPYDAGQAW